MTDNSELLTVDQYRDRLRAVVAPASPQRLPLRECLGLVLAEDITSTIALPSFDNSSMDGYAVHAADIAPATTEHPVSLPVIGESAAGGTDLEVLAAGTAAKIMTGAPLPPGADAVVPYEWTDRGTETVTINQAPAIGQHIRRAGDDITVGSVLATAGTRLGPRQLSLLAAVGQADALVHPRPRVAVISTGTELRYPGEPLGPSGIYDSNSVVLTACVEQSGGTVIHAGHVSDSPEDFLTLLDSLSEADIIVTSGGISMGDYDIVKAALKPRGLWFGGVAMQPGKPQGFGRLTQGPLLMALPGNPVSTFVSFHEFVLPVLRRLMALTPEVPPTQTATLAIDVSSPAGKRQYLRGTVTGSTVTPVGGPGSHLLGGLAHATCLIVIDEASTNLSAGDSVTVIELGDL